MLGVEIRSRRVYGVAGAVIVAIGGCSGAKDGVAPPVGPTAAISGRVTTTLGLPVLGAAVTVKPIAGPPAGPVLTTATGEYAVPAVAVAAGAGEISVTGVPSVCEPGDTAYVLPEGAATFTQDVVLHCTEPSETIAGVVTSSLGGPLDSARVEVVPDVAGGPTIWAVASDTGTYVVRNVPVLYGGGIVTVVGLPANCTADSTHYGPVANGAVLTVDVTVPCRLDVPVSLSSCRVIRNPGSYQLTADLAAGLSACITVAADDVSIACGGHRIVSLRRGIFIGSVKNAAVQDCVDSLVGPGEWAIYVDGTRHLAIRGVRAVGTVGVHVDSAEDVEVSGSSVASADSSGMGILIENSRNVVIESDTLNAAIPFLEQASGGVRIVGNVMHGTLLDGWVLGMFNGTGNAARRNTLSGFWYPDILVPHGPDYGILVMAESTDTLDDNTISDVDDTGISTVALFANSVVCRNRITNVGDVGIGGWMQTSWENNTIGGNSVAETPWLVHVFYYVSTPIINPAPIIFSGNTIANDTLVSRASWFTPYSPGSSAAVSVNFGGINESNTPLPRPLVAQGNVVSQIVTPIGIPASYLVPAYAFTTDAGQTGSAQPPCP